MKNKLASIVSIAVVAIVIILCARNAPSERGTYLKKGFNLPIKYSDVDIIELANIRIANDKPPTIRKLTVDEVKSVISLLNEANVKDKHYNLPHERGNGMGPDMKIILKNNEPLIISAGSKKNLLISTDEGTYIVEQQELSKLVHVMENTEDEYNTYSD